MQRTPKSSDSSKLRSALCGLLAASLLLSSVPPLAFAQDSEAQPAVDQPAADRALSRGSAASEGGGAAEKPAPPVNKMGALKQLVKLLLYMTDADYRKALTQLPPGDPRSPQIASRSAALKSVSTTLAALEYDLAARKAGEKADPRYAEAGRTLAARDPQAVGVDPKTLQEAGWAMTALKWLGSAALNYWFVAGPLLVGRDLGPVSEAARQGAAVDQLDEKLAQPGLKAADEADLHYQAGAAYEKLAAAAAEPEPEDTLALKKEARLKQLARLLETVSDDEYKEALAKVPAKNSKRAELASRGALLKSSYATLAALEYRQASRQAPEEAGAKYSDAYHRVAGGSASPLAINPENLQETGWIADFLGFAGMAAMGGAGYLIYKNQRRHPAAPSVPPVAQAPSVPPAPPAPPVVQPQPDKPPFLDTAPPATEPMTPPVTAPVAPPASEPPPTATYGECPSPTMYRDKGVCVPKTPPTYPMPTGRAAEDYRTLESLENELAGQELSPDKAAALHYEMGAKYESLAAATQGPEEAPKVSEPAPKAAAPKAAGTPQGVYKAVSPGVVVLMCSDREGHGELGTGSLIHGSGKILTNAHVAVDAASGRPYEQVRVYFKPAAVTGDPNKDLARYSAARVLAFDRELDLAALEVEAAPKGAAVVQLGDSGEVEPGEPVVAIGHPEQGGLWTLTKGIVSTVVADLGGVRGKDAFQTDASINRGNSGGPLLDLAGRQIGVNTSMARKAPDGLAITSVNFSLKSAVAKKWLSEQRIPFEEAASEAPAAPVAEPAPKAEPAKPAEVKEPPVAKQPPAAEPKILTPKKPYSIDDLVEQKMREMDDMGKEMHERIIQRGR